MKKIGDQRNDKKNLANFFAYKSHNFYTDGIMLLYEIWRNIVEINDQCIFEKQIFQ